MTASRDSNRVIIFDTTLRDGEQSPGAAMNMDEKVRIAQALDDMGVDVIEAGFPISSQGDFEAVKAIAGLVKNAQVAGLSRAADRDIDRNWEARQHAKRPRIHTFLSTSPLHMKYKLQMGPNAVLEAVGRSVQRARNLCEDVEWSAEDGSRTEADFLCRCVESAIHHGARWPAAGCWRSSPRAATSSSGTGPIPTSRVRSSTWSSTCAGSSSTTTHGSTPSPTSTSA
jgi:2-isopropylmalate synthase